MDQATLQKRLDALREKYDPPALAVGISQGADTTVLVSGLRKEGETAPVTPQDKFHMGSNGKAVTAALAHELAAEGLFSLSTTLKEVLPEMDIAREWQGITISQLLTHSSGLPRDYPDFAALRKMDALPAAEVRRHIAEEILKTSPADEVSHDYSYTNIGYVVLGFVMEQATGQSYEELVQQRIFDKLGMTGAGFGSPAALDAAQPSGHVRGADGKLIPVAADNPPAYAPAGTMHAPLGDWLKFLKSRMGKQTASVATGNGEYTDTAFLKQGDIFAHDGSNSMNYARVILLPKQDAAIVIATNDGSAQAQQAINELTAEMMRDFAKPKMAGSSPPKP